MFESGPVCLCEEGYSKYEDGSCLKPELETGSILCGNCDLERDQWTEWLNSGTTGSTGDWETLAGFGKNIVCQNPTGIEARRTDILNDSLLVTHINPEIGFWCANAEQDGAVCADFEVR